MRQSHISIDVGPSNRGGDARLSYRAAYNVEEVHIGQTIQPPTVKEPGTLS